MLLLLDLAVSALRFLDVDELLDVKGWLDVDVVDVADATERAVLLLLKLLVVLLLMPLRPNTLLLLFVEDEPAPGKPSKLLVLLFPVKVDDASFKMLLLLLLLMLLLVACNSVPKPPPKLLANCNLP